MRSKRQSAARSRTATRSSPSSTRRRAGPTSARVWSTSASRPASNRSHRARPSGSPKLLRFSPEIPTQTPRRRIMLDTVSNRVNGLDLAALGEVVEAIGEDPRQALVGFDVTTRWTGQTRSETTVEGFTMAGERITRTHKIVADEPCELLGADS